MNAAAVLEQLDRLGVSVQLDGPDLLLQPGSRVPPALLPELRACKGEIVAALSHRRVPRDTGLAPLLARLRKGQAWLTEHFDGYMDGQEPEGVYVRSLVQWDVLERLLRRLYGYQGCLSETGACDPGAPVWCCHCAETGAWRGAPEP